MSSQGLLATILVSLTAPFLSAAELTVLNPSFQDPVYADAGFNFAAAVPGWTKIGAQTTTWNPAASYYPSIPVSEQVIAIDGFGSGIRQELGDVLAPGTYTLQVSIGNRLSRNFLGYDLQLRAGGVTLAQDINGITPADGTFQSTTLTFEAPDNHSQLGNPLEILFQSTNLASSASVELDLVGLDFEPRPLTPEPATLGLFGIALATMAGTYWIRRRR